MDDHVCAESVDNITIIGSYLFFDDTTVKKRLQNIIIIRPRCTIVREISAEIFGRTLLRDDYYTSIYRIIIIIVVVTVFVVADISLFALKS